VTVSFLGSGRWQNVNNDSADVTSESEGRLFHVHVCTCGNNRKAEGTVDA